MKKPEGFQKKKASGKIQVLFLTEYRLPKIQSLQNAARIHPLFLSSKSSLLAASALSHGHAATQAGTSVQRPSNLLRRMCRSHIKPTSQPACFHMDQDQHHVAAAFVCLLYCCNPASQYFIAAMSGQYSIAELWCS
jgi:hypothetical protein